MREDGGRGQGRCQQSKRVVLTVMTAIMELPAPGAISWGMEGRGRGGGVVTRWSAGGVWSSLEALGWALLG